MFFKIVYFVLLFFVLTGMKLLLRDGNFIEVNSYQLNQKKVTFRKAGKEFILPEELVDIKSTIKLKELETRPHSIFKINSSIFTEKGDNKGIFYKEEKKGKPSVKNDYRIKLETRKETNPFFLEQPSPVDQNEDVIEKIKKKGVILKIEVPIKK